MLVKYIKDQDLFYLPYYVEPAMLVRIQRVRDRIKKDFDVVWLTTGDERAGKSVFSFQIARAVDPSFGIGENFDKTGIGTLERVGMNGQEFIDIVRNVPNGKAVVFDEALRGMSSVDWGNAINKLLKQLFAEIGQKNLFVQVNLPSLFYIEKYMALHRVSSVNRVIEKNEVRGMYLYYDRRRKKLAYIYGRDKMSWVGVNPKFRGRFTNYYCVDEVAYREKKRMASFHDGYAIDKNKLRLYAVIHEIISMGVSGRHLVEIIDEKYKVHVPRELVKECSRYWKEHQIQDIPSNLSLNKIEEDEL
jgi:hypothetical protein